MKITETKNVPQAEVYFKLISLIQQNCGIMRDHTPFLMLDYGCLIILCVGFHFFDPSVQERLETERDLAKQPEFEKAAKFQEVQKRFKVR